MHSFFLSIVWRQSYEAGLLCRSASSNKFMIAKWRAVDFFFNYMEIYSVTNLLSYI